MFARSRCRLRASERVRFRCIYSFNNAAWRLEAQCGEEWPHVSACRQHWSQRLSDLFSDLLLWRSTVCTRWSRPRTRMPNLNTSGEKMKRLQLLSTALVAVLLSTFAFAQTASAPATPPSVSTIIDRQIGNV